MHNLKEIRSNLKNFEDKIKQRNSDINIKALQNLDGKNRNLIQKKEKLEQEKKIISKTKDSSLFKKSKDLSKEIDNISFIFLIFFIGNIFVIPFYTFESAINQSFTIKEQYGFLLVLYVGIGPALISYLFWIKAIKIIGANSSGLFLNLIPIFSSLISIIFLKEKLELFHIVGALLIFTGIYLVIRKSTNGQN